MLTWKVRIQQGLIHYCLLVNAIDRQFNFGFEMCSRLPLLSLKVVTQRPFTVRTVDLCYVTKKSNI